MYGYVRSMSSLLIDVRVARDISNVSIIIVKCFIYIIIVSVLHGHNAVVARHS